MEASNAEKNQRGNLSQKSLKEILLLTKEKEYITDINENYKVGKEGFTNKKQFAPPYLITFDDDTQWALFTTTSIRDRVKAHYWDSLNLKELNHHITRAYVIYPDSISEKEKKTAISKNDKIISKHEYSSIEGIVSQEQIYNLIEEYGLRNANDGQKKNVQGNNFETRVATILKNGDNLKKWKNNSSIIDGLHYNIYLPIISMFNLNPNDVESIFATSDREVIGRLPSKGKVKTDVLVVVKYINDFDEYITISCKRSSKKAVSVHQYKAEDYSKVLDPNNSELKELLELFQKCGNARDMGTDNIKRLTDLIAPYNEKLSLWALGGQYGEGNPEIQWAQYMLTYDNNDNEISMHTIRDYYNKLKASKKRGAFGTLFSWTYNHNHRGESIVLQSTIIK